VVGEFGELDVGDAVAEELLLGKLLGEDDLGGDEEGGLAGFVGNGDIDEGAFVVALAAFEAEAAARHVFAGDDVVAALGMADASGVADFNARVLAAIDTGRIRLGRGRRHGENGTEALHDKLGAGGVNRGLRRSRGLRQRLRRGVERRLKRRNWCRRRSGRGGSGEERHLCVCGGRKRFRTEGGQSVGLGRFPERGGAAAPAETENAIARGEDVRFDAGVVDFFESLAGVADEREEAAFHFGGRHGRKVDVPKLQAGIHEGHAVGVDALLRAKLADDPDFRFDVAIGATKNELLFGGKLVMGNDAGAVEAEENGVGGLGENLAAEIAADQEDGNLFRDAAAAAHNLLWHAGGHEGVRSGSI